MNKAELVAAVAAKTGATKKAAELVETLEKAKDLIEQLNEMKLIILDQKPTTT